MTSAGGVAPRTRKVETTRRWSDGHGATVADVPGAPGSPTIALAIGVAPCEKTKSIRSSGSPRKSSTPGIVRWVGQVSPGTFTGFGWTARNESVKPAASTAAETGQRSG